MLSLSEVINQGRFLHRNITTHPELCQYPDGISATILHQSSWDHLQRICNSSEWPSLNPSNAACLSVQPHADRHLGRTSSRREERIEVCIARNAESICKITIDFIEYVLGGAAEENGARFGVFALGKECEISKWIA